nr:retrovirus-related Pol polyprotein from transposon TNT 1-94 [Tanacetum cinerariifolium]
MSRDVLTIGSTMRIPLLYRGEYSQRVKRFMNYLEEQTDEEAMINSIKNGDQPLPRVTQVSNAGTSSTKQPPLKDKFMWSDQEKNIQKIDRLARSLLIQGLPNDIYSLIGSNKTAKDLWDALARHMLGFEYGEQDRKAAVLYEYETFKATKGELFLDTYIRYLQVINDLKKCGYSKDNCELNFKFLNNLQPEWKQDVNDAMRLKKKIVVVTSDPLASIVEKTEVSKRKEKVVVSFDSEGSDADDFSELKKITALLTKAFNRRKFYSKPTNNNLRTSSTSHSDSDKEINANMVFMAQIEKVLSDSETSSSFADDKIYKVSYYLSESESESKYETSEYYDNTATYANTFEMQNKELNEQLKVLIDKNDDLLAQTKVLKDQLQVKHVVIDTHVECQEKYAKLEADRYEYMIRYSAYFDNDKQHRKQIADQEVLYDKMSVQLVELDKHVRDLKNTVLEKDFKISELKECQTNQTVQMIMPSKDTLYNGRKGIGFENPSYFEKAKDLRPNLYDEKVIGLGYNPMFLTHSDEALEIEKFKRARENKIKFAYDYGNFDKIDSPFQQTSSLKPYVSAVILEKIIVDLEDEVVCLLKKEKANLETIESLKSKGFESSKNAISESENQSENDCHVVEKECDQVENSKVIAPGMFKLSVSQSVSLISITKTSCASNDVEKTQVNLQLQVQRVRTDNGMEFKNKTLAKFFDEAGITQQFSAARTPQQNGVVERRNRTLVEAARTMLTFANLPMFLWAESIAIAYCTQNRSIIHKRFDKTPYELMNKRKPNIKFFRVFGCRCYLLSDYEDVGKLKAKGDIGVFVGYSKASAAFKIYNKRTRKIHESVNVNFDEISEMASKQFGLKPGLSNLNVMGKSSKLFHKFQNHQKKIWKIYFKNFTMSILML